MVHRQNYFGIMSLNRGAWDRIATRRRHWNGWSRDWCVRLIRYWVCKKFFNFLFTSDLLFYLIYENIYDGKKGTRMMSLFIHGGLVFLRDLYKVLTVGRSRIWLK
jgi:hypothetical protein